MLDICRSRHRGDQIPDIFRAQHVAFKLEQPVAIFSLEMSKEQLVNRLFSLESKVDAQK